MSIKVELTPRLVNVIEKRQRKSYYVTPLHRKLNIPNDIRHVIDIAFRDNDKSLPLKNYELDEALHKIKQSLESGKLYSYTRHNYDRNLYSPTTSIITIDDKLYLETDRLIELDNLFYKTDRDSEKNRKYRIIL